MDRDDAAPPTTTTRPHDRPSRTPFGPRRPKQSDYAHVAVQAQKTFVAPPPLAPPPPIQFDSTPIPWKGLSFEVAQWTFSSSELQEIVSKAIRLSARDSFVRLLSLQALEVDIVHEAARLDAERTAAQAKWRFEVARRTMLLQALNATAADDASLLVAQLATSVASCDALFSSILHYSDQQSQIALIQHQHSASALSVALRKLNRAYERQGQEFGRAQARVQTLEDELEEAWREAEKMAIEFDEFEQDVPSEHGPEDVRLPSPPLEVKLDVDDATTLGDVTIHTDLGVVLGVTATAVASKATIVHSPTSPDKFDKSDAKSVKSTRSRRSITHASRVSAARTRSRAASNASLRLPKSLRPTPPAQSSPEDTPPIPALPSPSTPGQSFLDMDLLHEHARKGLPPPPHPEPKGALPTPPHSACLPPTRVPSIWLETDGGKSTRLNGLDRTHSLHIFSSLTGRTPKKARRSNLVMSLTGSESASASATGSPVEADDSVESYPERDKDGDLDGVTGSPVSMHGSPVSLPHFHFRGPSASSSSNASVGAGCTINTRVHAHAHAHVHTCPGSSPGSGTASLGARISGGAGRPGSAGARLTTTKDTRTPVPVGTPRRSLVSRASSVILRRLSQATLGSARSTGSGGKGLRLARSREGLRSSGGGREGSVQEEFGEVIGEGDEGGEVMLIGSPDADPLDDP